MEQHNIVNYSDLNESQRQEFVEIFVEGFGHLMIGFTKDNAVLKKLFHSALIPSQFLAYVRDKKVLGIIGLGTNKIRPIFIVKKVSIELFGKIKGTLLTIRLNAVFQKMSDRGDGELHIDILATSKDARGLGVGTALLEYAFALPNYDSHHIAVLSKNTNAKRLYEKLGFVPIKKPRLPIFNLSKLGYEVKMKK